MTAAELFEKISYRLVGNLHFDAASEQVLTVTARANEAGAGSLFACVRTALGDGHDVAVTAYGNGCRLFLARRRLPLPDDAAVFLVEEPEALLGELAARVLGHPARGLTVFGITGTAGKTSVVQMAASMLTGAGHRVATLTTDGEWIGGVLTPAGNIVPDAADVQGFLRRAADAGADVALLEFSSYMLAQKSAFSIPFTALLLTKLWEAHVGKGEHASLADYRAAKELLFTHGEAPFCVLPVFEQDLAKSCSGRRLLYGENGDFYVENVSTYADENALGTRFTLCEASGEKVDVSLPVPGRFSVDNALCAAVLARIAGLSLAKIAAGLSDFKPFGRLACVAAKAGRYVLVDSAYTAESLTCVLQALRPVTRGRLSVVVGSVGGRAKARRAPLGAAAVTHADVTYFTADDPDGEDPVQICREMAAGATETETLHRYVILPDRARAIERAVLEMRPGDVLVLSGKGGQRTQLVRGKKLPLAEEDIVKEALLLV